MTVSSFLGLTNLRGKGTSISLLTITSSASDKTFGHLRSFPRAGSFCVLYNPHYFVLALTLICCRLPDLSPFVLVLAFAFVVTFQRFPDSASLHRHPTKLEVNSQLCAGPQRIITRILHLLRSSLPLHFPDFMFTSPISSRCRIHLVLILCMMSPHFGLLEYTCFNLPEDQRRSFRRSGGYLS